MRTRAIVERALLITLTFIFFLGSLYIPVIGIALALFSPVPLVILSMRYGLKRGVGSALIASFLILLVGGPFQAFVFVFNSAVVAIAVGFLVGKKLKPSEVIFYGTLVSLGAKVVFFAISALAIGINPLELNFKMIQDAFKSSSEFYERLGLIPKDSYLSGSNLNAFLNYLRIIFPAIIILASALDAFITFTVSGWVLRKLKEEFPTLPSFSGWRFPRSIFWGMVTGVLFSIIGEQTSNSYLINAGANLQIVFGALFMIQGASLIDYFMKRFNLKRFIRVIIILFIFTQPFLSKVSLFLGMFDLILDFRRRRGGL
ncbi:MAG: YybS family protein [Synergistetes bacterium]|nr:YybS family protein [Synergistota bacterium]MCX8127261.1 YybS family protein [Synergistota bacterium]MDW8191853.1 YybS family protein [Synergistota bacterium]